MKQKFERRQYDTDNQRYTTVQKNHGPDVVFVYTADLKNDETHDLLINNDGQIISESVWGGYDDLPCNCPACGGYWKQTEQKNRFECWDCDEVGWDGYHCLILKPPEKHIYHSNEKISCFHWYDVDLEVW